MEAFSIKIINKNSKNILISTRCGHPSIKVRYLKEYLKIFFTKPILAILSDRNGTRTHNHLIRKRTEFVSNLIRKWPVWLNG